MLAGISVSMDKCFNTPGNKTVVRVDVIRKARLNRFLLLRVWLDSLEQVCGFCLGKSTNKMHVSFTSMF